MANEITYFDTPFTFINPVRYFKANDPYYFEVDNIPIKQLEESSKFLKDQVDGILSAGDKTIEIDRKGFSELRPYAVGNDRKVRVKPGRYTARINNAFTLTPLQVIAQIDGYSNTVDSQGNPGDLNTWTIQTNIGPEMQVAWDEFRKGLQGNALNMNGLAERTFVFPIDDEDGVSHPNGVDFLNVSSPGYDFENSYAENPQIDPSERALYPNYIGALLEHSTPLPSIDLQLLKNVYTPGETSFGGAQGRLESAFIKRWRGAIRTSVVDIPNELEITVPDFEGTDFFYYDTNGEKVPLDSRNRIDLLFIYSKAIDEEATTISKFDSNGNPTTLTEPALGIVRGAGIGFSQQTKEEFGYRNDRVPLRDLDGTPIMMAHPGDISGSNTGFATSAELIKGSFPSPDDLMNLAPVLSENLESTALPLIGQSILPLAYIRVQNAGGPIADLITEEDIIDIRPFFRTTELAYNERAGIAAATPQISIANPVVTEAHVEKIRKEVVTWTDNRLKALEGVVATPTSPTSPAQTNLARVVGYGNVLGGFNYGPEGTLAMQLKANIGGGIETAAINNVVYSELESELGLAAGSISYKPQWDLSRWVTQNFAGPGSQPNDYINVAHGSYAGKTTPTGSQVKAFGTRVGTENPVNNTAGQLAGIYAGGDGRSQVWRGSAYANRKTMMFYVSKRVGIDRSQVPWMADYDVDVEFLNCIPLIGQVRGGQGQGIWVNKFKDYFVINVAWVGPDWRFSEAENLSNYVDANMLWGGEDNGNFGISRPPGTALKPWANRNDSRWFCGFALPNVTPKSGGLIDPPAYATGPISFRDGLNYGYEENETVISNGGAGSKAFTKAEYLAPLTPILYPSITFSITGYGEQFKTSAFGTGGNRMASKDPIISLG